jgi:hypothetical protein
VQQASHISLACDDTSTVRVLQQTRFVCRAEKFGIPLKPKDTELGAVPKQPSMLQGRLRKERAKKKDLVHTGFDLYSAEERAKQDKRASRFGTSRPVEGVAIARLSEGEQAKKNRAAKFGLHYEESERSGAQCKHCFLSAFFLFSNQAGGPV